MNPQIITETDEYFVIEKPAGMATEPPATTNTVKDWLIDSGYIKMRDWDEASRFGVVHRLDTDTSGVLIWAKDLASQAKLRQLWQGRAVKKNYLALVAGECPENGVIEVSLMRDNKNDRQIVALLPTQKSRPAITEYQRLAVGEFANKKVSLIEARPITGRTHQIRVHLKSIGHPIIGDKLYGEKETREIASEIGLARQFLHASALTINEHSYTSPLPADLQSSLKKVNIQFSR